MIQKISFSHKIRFVFWRISGTIQELNKYIYDGTIYYLTEV